MNIAPGSQLKDKDPALGGLTSRSFLVGSVAASALAAFGIETALPTASGDAYGTTGTSASSVQCNPNGSYNTIICIRSKNQTIAYCDRAITIQQPEGFKETLSSDNNSLNVSFGESDLSGCAPAVVRRLTFYEELRVGPTGTFTKNGTSKSIESNKPVKVHDTLSAPIDCSVAGMAGSAVRGVVITTAVPRKGWGHKQATATYTRKAQPVC